jgi:hypothetical protein
VRAVIAVNLLLTQQIIVLRRGRPRPQPVAERPAPLRIRCAVTIESAVRADLIDVAQPGRFGLGLDSTGSVGLKAIHGRLFP